MSTDRSRTARAFSSLSKTTSVSNADFPTSCFAQSNAVSPSSRQHAHHPRLRSFRAHRAAPAPHHLKRIHLGHAAAAGKAQRFRRLTGLALPPLRVERAKGEEEREEGCLSLPENNTPVLRSLKLRMRSQDLEANPIDETAEGFVARVWQHETDHLDGVLFFDRMRAMESLTYLEEYSRYHARQDGHED